MATEKAVKQKKVAQKKITYNCTDDELNQTPAEKRYTENIPRYWDKVSHNIAEDV